jgi:hypothetical protein
MQCNYKVNLRHVCATTVVALGKSISIAYSECVSVALGTQNAMCICHVILSSLAFPVLQ